MLRLSPEFVALTQDACLKAFWTKNALRTFLRMHKISDKFLNKLADGETKSRFLSDLFYRLSDPNHFRGEVIFNIAESLASMTHFPDLEGWDDSHSKICAAKEAINRLKIEVDKIKLNNEEKQRREKFRQEMEKKKQESILSQNSIRKMAEDLDSLSKRLGTQDAGYAFESWFYNLAIFFDIDSKPAYRTDGRQIDGAITIDGTTFLIETKFTKNITRAQDIDIFMAKVNTKADNTMGIFISMAGYSEEAIKAASRDKTPLLLFDYRHIYNLILSNVMTLDNLIRRAKRHTSQTGESYLEASKFSG